MANTIANEEKDEKMISIRVEKALNILSSVKGWEKIKAYEKYVLAFVIKNVREEYIANDSSLINVVRAYIEYLTNPNVDIKDLLSLYSRTHTDNEIRSEILRRYFNITHFLMSACDYFDIDENESPDKIINIMLEMYQDQRTKSSVFSRIYMTAINNSDSHSSVEVTKYVGSLIDAFETLLSIKDNSSILFEQEDAVITHH